MPFAKDIVKTVLSPFLIKILKHTHICMIKKEATNFKESKEGYTAGFEGGNGSEE